MSAAAIGKQKKVVRVVGARCTLGLVKGVIPQVGGIVTFYPFGNIGSFQPPPTVVVVSVLQMFLVHFALYILPVTADFGCHADGDFVRFQ